MAKAKRYMAGKYLNVETVESMSEAERVVTISHIAEEVVQNVEKLVAYFKETDAGLPLNNARIERLVNLHNGEDETDKWRGTKVRLCIDPTVRFQGRRVGGVDIEAVPTAAPTAAAAQ